MKTTGKLYVIGIGPGSYEDMTIRAVNALNDSEIIVGYTVYVDLLREHFPEKEMLTTPMRQEQERCQMAILKALEGKRVAMVCSGDSGVYGMSGLILQLAKESPDLEIEVIPGVTAALSGGAVLGAPLGHDFAVISLSDLLTPMELIEDRLKNSARSDMVICLYNPSSKKRADYLKNACDIVLQHQKPETVCGLVRNIGRDGEEMEVLTLSQLKDTNVDMFTTVYIGNSMTREINGRMVTPRGYKNV
ncbi:precorrin-3B C17-methyltransferase [Lacrimispora xylanisolvens]|uniref:Precorrin-3B C17-methyltransferase n=1 Tax=Lacrimispora xylanisolvens TaxID=384636 RepID=A0A2S6HNX0_9FIRM|nr:precorrin-3B C(17)-methyltransferase [Hungatella xylanolytica]PPK79203.1 precorrin-3B C17-methyltransferase [Hungatella xylanolytica]